MFFFNYNEKYFACQQGKLWGTPNKFGVPIVYRLNRHLSHYFRTDYSIILATRPDPIVRPPLTD